MIVLYLEYWVTRGMLNNACFQKFYQILCAIICCVLSYSAYRFCFVLLMCSFILCYRKVIQARTFSVEFKSSYLLGVLQEHKADTIIIIGLQFGIFQWYKFVYLCIQFGKSYTFCLVMWWITECKLERSFDSSNKIKGI